ncbi:tetratricopeptide repeat protein [Flavobacterium sp. HTF]|uniref:tetratricopeptide repeat protein n=1 Tax=Flavobacterium sp. HTF TaxID=2170732 RepID=UPI000D5CD732|nr:tetratricopeptide repeat protein [Flavobacterium sp. HTF]PWB27643.1 hypothetical protein DCO46_02490 [Flavobacterium sp. HTF]
MTDHQFLGVAEFPDKNEIKEALAKKIHDLDFENDIETIFDYIKCSKRIVPKKEIVTVENDPVLTDEYREIIKDFGIEGFDTPEKLIGYFTSLYDNPSLRFHKLLWKSAIDSLSIYDYNKRLDYVIPVVEFLCKKSFIKPEVLRLIGESLPFEALSAEVFKEDNPFWAKYNFVCGLLQSKNIEFELYADILNTGQFTSEELDYMFTQLMISSVEYRNENYRQAFSILHQQIADDIKPAFIVEREFNILHKIISLEKKEEVPQIYLSRIKNAFEKFPDHEEFLYLRIKILFESNPPEKFREQVISALKIIPGHSKCLFLLGKCYMKLGISKTALTIFENLMEMHPLNVEYVTNAALATRQYIDSCFKVSDQKSQNKAYYINIINFLTEKKLFSEIPHFASKISEEDNDLKALLLYAKDAETFLLTGEKDKAALLKAIDLASDKEVVRKIKEYYLKELIIGPDYEEENKFIRDYYQENAANAVANYKMALFYFGLNEIENAYTYFLKSKEINPSNIRNYIYLARCSNYLGRSEETMAHVSIYLMHNTYDVMANEIYCDAAYSLKQYKNAYEGTKWLLSICNDNERDAKYFFYFTASLSLYLSEHNEKYYNLQYVNEMLGLYDQYPKPNDFWTNDNGSTSMYWAATLCYQIGHYEKGAEYLQCILENTKEHNWNLTEKCLQLLAECLLGLEQYDRIIELIEPQVLKVLEKNQYDVSVSQATFYLSYAYFAINDHESRMKWALTSVYCFMQAENPDTAWAENYLVNNLAACLEFDVKKSIIPIGKAYLEIVKTPNPNHIWVAYTLANAYSANGEQNEASRYYRICFEFGTLFPGVYTEEIKYAEQFLKTFHQ